LLLKAAIFFEVKSKNVREDLIAKICKVDGLGLGWGEELAAREG